MIASGRPPRPWQQPRFVLWCLASAAFLVLCKGLGFADGWWFW